MLDLGLAKESDGGLVALTPEVLVGQVEGIVELDGGVGLLGDGLEVGLGCREGRGGGTLLRTSSEGGGRAGEEESGELHSSWCCFRRIQITAGTKDGASKQGCKASRVKQVEEEDRAFCITMASLYCIKHRMPVPKMGERTARPCEPNTVLETEAVDGRCQGDREPLAEANRTFEWNSNSKDTNKLHIHIANRWNKETWT